MTCWLETGVCVFQIRVLARFPEVLRVAKRPQVKGWDTRAKCTAFRREAVYLVQYEGVSIQPGKKKLLSVAINKAAGDT